MRKLVSAGVLMMLLGYAAPAALYAQATPIVFWNDPPDMVVRTPLGPAQLNATASVPGTFTYSPTMGISFSQAGTFTLSLTFTPTDRVNYKIVNTFVHVTVLEGRITGKFTNSAGTPIGSLIVIVHDSTGNQVGQGLSSVDGTYTIQGLPGGDYYVATRSSLYTNQAYGGTSCGTADCDGISGRPVSVTLGSTTQNVDFTLVPMGSISGRVTLPTGVPISGMDRLVNQVGVGLYDASGNPVPGLFSSFNSDGTYSISSIVQGTYFAKIVGEGYSDQLYGGNSCDQSCSITSSTPIVVNSGQITTNINFQLRYQGGISGIMTIPPESRTIYSGNVNIYNAAGGLAASSLFVDFNGAYSIKGLAAGTYYAVGFWPFTVEQAYNGITCQGCIPTNATPITVTAGAVTTNINFNFSSGQSISGRVMTAGNAGVPLVTILAQNSVGKTFSVFADTNGGYSIPALAPGIYYLRTKNSGDWGMLDQAYGGIPCNFCSLPAGVPVELKSGSNLTNINFVLSPGGWISGKVTDANNVSIQSTTIEVYDAAGNLLSTNPAAADGTYFTPAMYSGSYFLRTRSNQYYVDRVYGGALCGPSCNVTTGTPVAVTPGSPTPNINFVLGSGGSITGKVVDEMAAPLPNIMVQLYDSTGHFVYSTSTVSSWGYSFVNVIPGSYYAIVSNNPTYIDRPFDGPPCSGACPVTSGRLFAVTAGQTTSNINFVLIEGSHISGRISVPGTFSAAGIAVEIYGSMGELVRTAVADASGTYRVDGLRPGTYFARTRNTQGFTDQLYGAAACLSCTITAGTPITVAAVSTAANVNFTLAPVLHALAPPAGGQGGILQVTLTGANFANGMTINAGLNITVSDAVVLSPSALNAKFTISPSAVLGTRSVNVTISGAISNTVTFDVTPPALTVSRTGTGDGLIVSSPAGIQCGGSCATPFSNGQIFALTAAPAAGSVFAGWGGDADCVDGSVTMTAARNCTARFDLPQLNSTVLRGDYDGDGKTDIVVYRPSTGEWFLRLSSFSYAYSVGNWYFQWGVPGDIPLSGDFDGDGKSDISVYRPSTGEWFHRLSGQNYAIASGNWYFQWGVPGDIPVTGDFDGDGNTDITVYRPSTGEWFSRLSTKNYAVAAGNWYFQWGVPGDQPIAGDFDGDGKTDVAVFRPSTGEWFLRLSSQNYAVTAGNWYFQWGVSGDLPVAGDYDGDRKTDIAVYRPLTGEWFLRLSSQNYAVTAGNWYFQWGVPGDQTLKGDFDGDQKADLAVYRPSTGEWFFRLSAQNYSYFQGNWYFQWGLPGDLAFRR